MGRGDFPPRAIIRSRFCSRQEIKTLSPHRFRPLWLRSSVVSVLISVTTDMSPTGDLLVT